MINKKKIINDPLYGFVHIPHDILFDLIEHRYFQRLRRIKQLGMSHLVYPGALHTRFNHAIGALHLMLKAIDSLRSKGIEITLEEEKGACIGILLHDIGHGPFSHTLEHSIVRNIAHEKISLAFMEKLNKEFDGQLELAIQIFKGEYKKKFLCQLISGQLDTDRLDYLNRDSFFTGVAEGVVGAERIIHMMDVKNDNLVVHQKGVYSLEKFIVARRLMYWQVYLHKTVVAADVLLTNLLKRAKQLCDQGVEVLSGNGPFKYFLESNLEGSELLTNDKILDTFSNLDDVDVLSAIKEWTLSEDKILKTLSNNLLNRRLPKFRPLDEEISDIERDEIFRNSSQKFDVDIENAHYFSGFNSLENSAYLTEGININILLKNGDTMDLVDATDNSALSQFTKTVKKFYACYY